MLISVVPLHSFETCYRSYDFAESKKKIASQQNELSGTQQALEKSLAMLKKNIEDHWLYIPRSVHRFPASFFLLNFMALSLSLCRENEDDGDVSNWRVVKRVLIDGVYWCLVHTNEAQRYAALSAAAAAGAAGAAAATEPELQVGESDGEEDSDISVSETEVNADPTKPKEPPSAAEVERREKVRAERAERSLKREREQAAKREAQQKERERV